MLPIDALIPDLISTLDHHTTVLLQAPPGAGKTTRVPPALLGTGWRQQKKILMLEPRRLAARSAARFMARQLGEQPGDTIGYRTRLDSRTSPHTQIEVVTEGILTRMIQADPALEDYAAVVFDEFHERSLQADLGLALVRECQQALRDDLRVVVMSATLNTAPLARLLDDAPVLSSDGRAYPVTTYYQPVANPRRLLDAVAACILTTLGSETGSVLVFLPGVAEIRRVEQTLRGQLPTDCRLAPLYGNLSAADQDRAIAPAPDGERKVVLATAIAETSLTIEGIRVVIDSGQQRRAIFDANSGMTRLVTKRLSKAAADQRKGRAGRTEAGACYRLWSDADQFSLADFTVPEILEADLTPLVLELAQWGARSPEALTWIDLPPQAHWQQAVALLQWLGLLDADGAITASGKAARRLGCHPRLAHMILCGRDLGWPHLAAELAALLEERDILGRSHGADMHQRVRVLRNEEPAPQVDAGRLKSIRRAAARWRPANQQDRSAVVSADEVGRLLALAYPDRIACKRPGEAPRYRLSNGRGAVLRDDDSLARFDWLATAELDGQAREATVYLAAPVSLAVLQQDLGHRIETVEEAVWDDSRGTVVARRQQRLGQLVLSETVLPTLSAAQVERGLLTAVRHKGLCSLPWTPVTIQWRSRVTLIGHHQPNHWPEVGDTELLATLEHWLLPFLAGMTRWSQVQQMDLLPALTSLLDYDQQQRLAQLAPASLTIPTGDSRPVDYTADGGPVLAAKLQSLFGWQHTPCVINGTVPVVIHLLSPARRPLAVTADLASFWQNGYPGVRKDTRGRYPKHPWPEDPLSAEATRGTKKQGV
ncbi:ATP-dependent helicase HrpB [Marinobacter caseinilyticus]|uniref:ATP-dependent helicase HrpB n=1 Tax=Marinobacter caseinilyticus TaxID=2692195 RepID=UPI00140DE6AF|nr:ATP-dependent helicase HrpB [Marinobacter caseinilyticus]